MKKYLTLALGLLICGNAMAVEWNVIDNVHIKSIRAQGQADVISFITIEPTFNPAKCGSTQFYEISKTEEMSGQMLSILLSAAAINKTVGLNVHSGECASSGRPKVLDVWINY